MYDEVNERLPFLGWKQDNKPASSFLICSAREDNKILYASNSFLEKTGYELEEVVGRNPRFLQGSKSSMYSRALFRELTGNLEEGTVCITNYAKDGSEFEMEVSLFPIFDGNEEAMAILGILNIL